MCITKSTIILKIKTRMKNLRSFYNKFKIKDLLYFVLILPISITLISNGACDNSAWCVECVEPS